MRTNQNITIFCLYEVCHRELRPNENCFNISEIAYVNSSEHRPLYLYILLCGDRTSPLGDSTYSVCDDTTPVHHRTSRLCGDRTSPLDDSTYPLDDSTYPAYDDTTSVHHRTSRLCGDRAVFLSCRAGAGSGQSVRCRPFRWWPALRCGTAVRSRPRWWTCRPTSRPGRRSPSSHSTRTSRGWILTTPPSSSWPSRSAGLGGGGMSAVHGLCRGQLRLHGTNFSSEIITEGSELDQFRRKDIAVECINDFLFS